jgi:hypothetical protein
MRKLISTILALTATSALVACQTTFTGDPKFPGGPRGCYDKCIHDGMMMTAFVHAGEYSTACVCGPAPRVAEAGPQGAPVAAAVGVMAQMRAAQQQQQAHNTGPH